MSSHKRHKNKHPSDNRYTPMAKAHPPTQPSTATDEIAAPRPSDDSAVIAIVETIEASPPAVTDPSSTAAIGAQLQAAREAQGLSLADAGQKLRLPARVLRKLEADDLSGIDYPIYLRGYLRSYSKLLGVTLPSMQSTIDHAAVSTPTLTPTGGMSHGRYLLQRYSVAATYLVVTALIVVPVLVLGLNGGIGHESARVAPLETVGGAPAAQMAGATIPAKTQTEPLMASMAPFGALQKDLDRNNDPPPAAAARVADAPTTHAAPADEHNIDLELQAPSWVEITDASGTRLEYGMLSAGNYRYHSDQILDIRLGNSSDAVVDVDGTALDLQPYRRANVAHFRLDPKTGKPPKAKNG